MRKLEFIGTVQANASPELTIPGRDDLFLKPEDWPKQLAPGTVAIEITAFPDFLERAETDRECGMGGEDARNLMLLEWAKELLLENDENK
jgi:hypothetical protein